jgi:hypothetical protein
MRIGHCLVAIVLMTTLAVLAAEQAKTISTFEDDAPGAAPRGFSPAVGELKVASIGEGKVLAQLASNANSVFNVALVDDTNAKDVDISVKVKAMAGELDQGGGLVWRAKDPKNYYIARYNHLEDNYRVHKVVDGKRSPPFQNADVKHHDGWTVVRVTMKGDHIECYLESMKYLDAHDSTFPDAGKIGLWSKADARSQFDDLVLVAR